MTRPRSPEQNRWAASVTIAVAVTWLVCIGVIVWRGVPS